MKLNTLFVFVLAIFLVISCDEKKEKSTTVPDQAQAPLPPPKAQLEFEIEALLGEGAFWNYKTQEFYWIDIEGKKLHIYDPATKINRSHPTPSRIGTVVPRNAEWAVVALEDGVYLMNTTTGKLEIVSNVEQEMTINRFNDGKCDPNGNLWVGSMHLEQAAPMGSVYKITGEGETTKMIDSVTISNGIVWTKDASTMYYIDTPTGKIMAYDFDSKTSTISNGRTAVEVSTEDGFPDGMAIDENDMLWVGLWNGNCVANFDPTTGKLLQKIAVPAHNVTSCAFGGKNLDQLYITTSSLDMTDDEKDTYPLAGSLFVANVGVKGVKSQFFAESKTVLANSN